MSQKVWWFTLAALVMTAASNTQSESKSAAARKQHSIQSAASPNEGGHHAAEADAETFTGANVMDEHTETVLKKHVRARRQQANNAAAQNPINAIGKILKKAGNRAENAISNTLKSGGKKQPAKKNKAKGKGTQAQGKAGAQQPRVNRKTSTAVPNPDYSDIEVDENGNPVVLNEDDIPEEHDADPKSANQTGSDDQLEDFPPYGGDYAGAMDEGPVSYPDENPPTPPKKNKKKFGKKKNNGKKGGKKAITKRNKKKTNKKQGLLDPGGA